MKIKYKIFVFFIALLVFKGSLANCHSIDGTVVKLMQNKSINGMAIAIVDHNQVEFCNYGYTAANKRNKVDQHTLFEIASISKTFTATLAGVADAEGIFQLKEPIRQYVSEIETNPAYQEINSQQLLSHVSGLNFSQETNFGESKPDFIRGLKIAKTQYLPETHYQYGQVGISLVALALENIYHLSFDDILQQQLLNKLNMRETFISIPLDYKNRAIGYNQNNKPVAFFEIGSLTPAAGLKSTTYDLVKYLKLQFNNLHDLTFDKALNLVHKNYYCLYSDGTYQQLAWVYHPSTDLSSKFQPNTHTAANFQPQKLAQNCAEDPNGFIEKTGNSSGMSSYIIYLPKEDSGVIVLTNKARVADIINLARSILNQELKK